MLEMVLLELEELGCCELLEAGVLELETGFELLETGALELDELLCTGFQ